MAKVREEKLADFILKTANKTRICDRALYFQQVGERNWFSNGHWGMSLPMAFGPKQLIAQVSEPTKGAMFFEGSPSGNPFEKMADVFPKSKGNEVTFTSFTHLVTESITARLFLCNGELQGVDSDYLAIATDLLRYDTIFQSAAGAPVAFYAGEALVGMIMPIRVERAKLLDEMNSCLTIGKGKVN
jgi:hypothetical protein